MRVFLFLVLGGCVPPSTLGLMTDGGIPAGGAVSAHVGVHSSDEILSNASYPAGLGYEHRLGDSSSLSGGVATLVGDDEFGGVLTQLELKRKLSDHFSVLGGAGAVWVDDASIDSSVYIVGIHAGAVASMPVGSSSSAYLGLKLNPIASPKGLEYVALYTALPLGILANLEPVQLGVELFPSLFISDGNGDLSMNLVFYLRVNHK